MKILRNFCDGIKNIFGEKKTWNTSSLNKGEMISLRRFTFSLIITIQEAITHVISIECNKVEIIIFLKKMQAWLKLASECYGTRSKHGSLYLCVYLEFYGKGQGFFTAKQSFLILNISGTM